MIIQTTLAAMSTAVFAMAVTQFTKRIGCKPFNCELCMTFWISLLISLMAFNYVLDAITFVGIAVFTRQLLWKVWATMF
jgi:hypothetical protein